MLPQSAGAQQPQVVVHHQTANASSGTGCLKGVGAGLGITAGIIMGCVGATVVGFLVLFGGCMAIFKSASSAPPTPYIQRSSTPLPPPPDPSPSSPASQVVASGTLDDFGRRYDNNHINVDLSYSGKIIQVSGKVESIQGTTQAGRILLRGMTTNAAMDCQFNEQTTPDIARVQTGQIVTVTGRYVGMQGGTMTMEDCRAF